MSGTKGRSGRPGGNPDIKLYGFKAKGDEPFTEQVHLRISKSQKAKIDALGNWRDKLRDWIDNLPDPSTDNQN